MISLSSERFFYREALLSDASFFLALFNDKDWLRFIGDRNVRTIADAESFIANQVMPVYLNHGLGMRVICDKQDCTPLGLIGLLKRDYLDAIDLGYALLQTARGNGVIAESTPIFIDLAFEVIDSSKLYATVNAYNAASIRVLQSNNFDLLTNQELVADLPDEILLFVRYKDGHVFVQNS